MNHRGSKMPSLEDYLEKQDFNQWEIRLAVLGGGTGGPRIIQGLVNYPVHVDSVTTMFDSGGSSGTLRKKFNILPPSDFTRAILAHVVGDHSDLEMMLMSRVPPDEMYGDFAGHTAGNLAYFVQEASGKTRADAVRTFVNALKKFQGFRGTPYPVSLERAHIMTVLSDGSLHPGEAYLDERKIDDPPIRYVYLKPDVIAYVAAVEAVQRADLTVAAMGSFYGSTLATMLPLAMPEAIVGSGGLAFPLPLMTMPNETHGYTAIDYVEKLLQHVPTVKRLEALLVNKECIPPDVEAKYAAKGQYPVHITPHMKAELEAKYCNQVIENNYVDENWMRANDGEIRHDSEVLAEDLIRIAYEMHKSRKDKQSKENIQSLLVELDRRLDVKE